MDALLTTGEGERSTTTLLADLRRARGFDADEVLAAKVGRIGRWFSSQQLDAAVVGVSGGVDSAVVVGLLMAATRAAGSPLRRVVAVSIPITGPGSTAQDVAERRADMVASAFGAELWTCPLGDAHVAFLDALRRGSGGPIDGWTAGQMLSVERTPLLYGAAAALRSAGGAAVVVGTTNRDEGAYLGFFGKASDGMVDVQPISDLHKSEVVALASRLGVPQEIVDAPPSGDVWDGRTDAQMIGVGYDDVELILRLRELGFEPAALAPSLVDADRLVAADAAVERLHATNRHKYRVGSPAVHLDVLPRAVPDGWLEPQVSRSPDVPPPGLPGRWDPPSIGLDRPRLATACRRARCSCAAGRRFDGLDGVGGLVVEGHDVLTAADCCRLVEAVRATAGEPVGVTGVAGSSGVGSVRSTAFSPELAERLWERVRPLVPSVRFLGPYDPSEGHATETRSGHRSWRAVGMSPLLRFMRYGDGGRHLCHYDAAYEYPDGRRTLLSMVCFLTGDGFSGAGGALRFVRDGQFDVPVWERDHTDWSRDTEPDEVVHEVIPRAGSVVLFDHRTCHDVERWLGPDDRIVIRGDIVFEPIDDGRSLP